MTLDWDDLRASNKHIQLRQGMESCLDESELVTLCFDLGVDYESLNGRNRSAKIVSIIEYFFRVGRLNQLTQYLERLRPNVEWPQWPESTTVRPPVTQRPSNDLQPKSSASGCAIPSVVKFLAFVAVIGVAAYLVLNSRGPGPLPVPVETPTDIPVEERTEPPPQPSGYEISSISSALGPAGVDVGVDGAVNCPSGMLATGISGRFGTRIDRLGLVCRTLLPSGVMAEPPYVTDYIGGEGGGGIEIRDAECPPNKVLVGITVWSDSQEVISIRGDCVNVDRAEASPLQQYGGDWGWIEPPTQLYCGPELRSFISGFAAKHNVSDRLPTGIITQVSIICSQVSKS